jgi:hypothetical protein
MRTNNSCSVVQIILERIGSSVIVCDMNARITVLDSLVAHQLLHNLSIVKVYSL